MFLKAPLYAVQPGWSDRPAGKLGPYSTRIEITTAKGPCGGIAYFDGQPEFPSFAVFLDTGTAILVRVRETITEDGNAVYVRIGAASFVLEDPISQADPRIIITIE